MCMKEICCVCVCNLRKQLHSKARWREGDKRVREKTQNKAER